MSTTCWWRTRTPTARPWPDDSPSPTAYLPSVVISLCIRLLRRHLQRCLRRARIWLQFAANLFQQLRVVGNLGRGDVQRSFELVRQQGSEEVTAVVGQEPNVLPLDTPLQPTEDPINNQGRRGATYERP